MRPTTANDSRKRSRRSASCVQTLLGEIPTHLLRRQHAGHAGAAGPSDEAMDGVVHEARSGDRRPGNPFSGKVNKLKPDGEVAKGPVGQRASGYSIIDAPSLEAATKLA